MKMNDRNTSAIYSAPDSTNKTYWTRITDLWGGANASVQVVLNNGSRSGLNYWNIAHVIACIRF